MPSAIVDFIAKVNPDPAKCAALDTALETLRSSAPFERVPSMHFASLVVFEGDENYPPVLVFENNYDGDLALHVQALLAAAAPALREVYSCCTDFPARTPAGERPFADYLLAHAVQPAAWHIGNVGRSRERVRQELGLRTTLGARMDARLDAGAHPDTPVDAHALAAEEVKQAGTFGWIGDPHVRMTAAEIRGPTVKVWLTGGVLVLALLTAFWINWWLTLLLIVAVVATLLWKESRDQPLDPAKADVGHVRRLVEHEDFRVQNHLASITIVKPGIFRRLLLRVVLWGANLLARTSIHGELSGIPSIHYAHWVLLDGGRRLLFLSNFDGSWESYLDDFIDKASKGLTGIWTNTVGFPRTRLLVLDGATDGIAFKAFARSQQTPSAVWYSAYPDLTVQQIDSQSTLREGLATRPTGAALADWLRRI